MSNLGFQEARRVFTLGTPIRTLVNLRLTWPCRLPVPVDKQGRNEDTADTDEDN